jgi:replicative DNA helicase
MSDDGLIDYHNKAEIIISKHRKGATGIVMMDFKGEFTRFENPEDKVIGKRPSNEGEIRDSAINGSNNDLPFPPQDSYSFDEAVNNDN